MQSLQQLVALLQAATPVLLQFIVLLGALAGVATAIGGLLVGIVKLFKLPADGKLAHAANACNAIGIDFLKLGGAIKAILTKMGVLAVPGAAALLAIVLSLAATRVQAQPILSAGPTLPLIELRPGQSHPVNLAAGAGLQVSATLPQLQRAFLGKAWDLLDLQLMAFGSVVNGDSEHFGALSAAVGLCTMSSMLCIGGGRDVIDGAGVVGGGGWFAVAALSFNFALAPVSPPAGVAQGAAGLARGNTLYLGSF